MVEQSRKKVGKSRDDAGVRKEKEKKKKKKKRKEKKKGKKGKLGTEQFFVFFYQIL